MKAGSKTLLVAAILACESSAEQPPRRDAALLRSAASVSGTYDFRVCRGTCTGRSAQVLREGRLMLLDRPIDPTGLRSGVRIMMGPDDAANACWVGRTLAASPDSTVWDFPVGVSAWEYNPASGELRFKLGEDIHTSYPVSGRFRGDSILARGRLLEFMGGERWLSDDSVVARRVEPTADPSLCYTAAESAWAELRMLRMRYDTLRGVRR